MHAIFNYLACILNEQKKVEGDVISRFLKETIFMQFHHLRALVWKADFMAKYGDYEQAITVIANMKAIYEPKLHNKALMNAYRTSAIIVRMEYL